MAITRQRNDLAKRARILLFALGSLAVGAVLWLLVWLARTPQMGADEEAFHTVDALFTAVTARDETLLAQCEQRLHAHRDAGKLPGEASDYLDGVIAKARDGRWQSAAEQLYQFMKVQRREGAQAPRPVRRTKAAKDG